MHLTILLSFAALLCAAEPTGGYPAAPSVINVKTAYGARGDGNTDDTDALTRALTEHVGRNHILWFPAGTYIVGKSLDFRRFNSGIACYITLEGEGPGRSVIRLRDRSPGFADASRPLALVMTSATDRPDPAGLGGNTGFGVYLQGLTLDTGSGNPGAIALDYTCHNYSALLDLELRSGDGTGVAGLAMRRLGPGPALVRGLTVHGFSIGIDTGMTNNYGVTLEHVRLIGQTSVAVANSKNGLFMRDLQTEGPAPVLRLSGPGLTVIDGGRWLGGAHGRPAVEGDGGILLRNITSTGWSEVLLGLGPQIREFARPMVGAGAATLGLAVEESPTAPAIPPSDWANVEDYGAKANDDLDDGDAIQKALDSGKPAIYLPYWRRSDERDCRYWTTRTLAIPPHVRLIEGFHSELLARPGGAFDDPAQPNPLFKATGAGDLLVVRRLHSHGWLTPAKGFFTLEHAAQRSVAVRHSCGNLLSTTGTGNFFLDDISGGWYRFLSRGQRVFARQLNPEGPYHTKVVNHGADLWILGLKTERQGTQMELIGGRTELLGGNLYCNIPGPKLLKPGMKPFDLPMVVARDATYALSFMTTSGQPEGVRSVVLEEERSGALRRLYRRDAPLRDTDTSVLIGLISSPR